MWEIRPLSELKVPWPPKFKSEKAPKTRITLFHPNFLLILRCFNYIFIYLRFLCLNFAVKVKLNNFTTKSQWLLIILYLINFSLKFYINVYKLTVYILLSCQCLDVYPVIYCSIPSSLFLYFSLLLYIPPFSYIFFPFLIYSSLFYIFFPSLTYSFPSLIYSSLLFYILPFSYIFFPFLIYSSFFLYILPFSYLFFPSLIYSSLLLYTLPFSYIFFPSLIYSSLLLYILPFS